MKEKNELPLILALAFVTGFAAQSWATRLVRKIRKRRAGKSNFLWMRMQRIPFPIKFVKLSGNPEVPREVRDERGNVYTVHPKVDAPVATDWNTQLKSYSPDPDEKKNDI